MNKLAVFTEGYTEVAFVEKLIEEIAGKNNVQIEHTQIRGGSTVPKSMTVIRAAKPVTGQRYYVLLVDCGNDELVKERIREEHENLTKAGYSKLIGIRDVRPKFTHAEIPKLEAYLPKYIKTKLIPVTFILAIMELEAWFLAESTHFSRIDPAITVAAIKATLGFDPSTDDMQQRLAPANDLNDCYSIGSKAYIKNQAKLTVDALDFAAVYLELRNRIDYLDRLISEIDTFLS